jgi:cytochrome c oxidase cbb3-type subunit 4
MDINDLRVIVTLFSMLLFVAIWIWAYSRRNLAAFEDAAQLPLREEEPADRNSREESA